MQVEVLQELDHVVESVHPVGELQIQGADTHTSTSRSQGFVVGEDLFPAAEVDQLGAALADPGPSGLGVAGSGRVAFVGGQAEFLGGPVLQVLAEFLGELSSEVVEGAVAGNETLQCLERAGDLVDEIVEPVLDLVPGFADRVGEFLPPGLVGALLDRLLDVGGPDRR